jgi:hypothetical protein
MTTMGNITNWKKEKNTKKTKFKSDFLQQILLIYPKTIGKILEKCVCLQ